LLRGRELTRVLEIGVSGGGTLALWAKLAKNDARLIGIDLTIGPSAQRLVNSNRHPKQTVHFIEDDSHREAVKVRVVEYLNAHPLDFLFIDGDHSYQGVKRDWEMYSPMVQAGGLIAFHDIIPDFGTRFGLKTNCYSGGVYRLWGELKDRFRSYEFIENPAQDGYGIGVLIL
jgi:predicted O-methyltransferase YrrM